MMLLWSMHRLRHGRHRLLQIGLNLGRLTRRRCPKHNLMCHGHRIPHTARRRRKIDRDKNLTVWSIRHCDMWSDGPPADQS